MNKNVVRALFDDAMAQVLDNLGFRILALLFLVPVLFAWVFGFREDGITVLFYWHTSWSQLFSFFGSTSEAANSSGAELRDLFFAGYEKFALDTLGDKFGLLFAVGAASFFMPRLLEKGSVDTIFSKPISRPALLMSRYVAGLLFVFGESTILIGGMYLGFRVVSGYDNSGMLWGIATLTYGFAVFHAISLVVAVFTRSAAASILVVAIFMPVNCAVHGIWRVKEMATDVAAGARKNPTLPANPANPANSAPSDPQPQAEPESGSLAWFMKVALVPTLNTLHYVLPKTTDTTLIARDLRKRIDNSEKEFVDDSTTLTIAEVPEGFAREQRSSISHDGLLWIAKHPAGKGEAHWTLARAKVKDTGSRTSLLKALKQRVTSDPNCSDWKSEHSDISGHPSERAQWTEKRGDEPRLRREWAFQDGEYMFTLDYDAESEWAQQEAQEHSAQVFVAGLRFVDETQANPLDASYEKRFGWHSELKYNAWFSILSTLAFIAAVLGIGWWKLSRTDF
jgi:ABC-type transport system involved in multi-copper enzyme maturation permease subunit